MKKLLILALALCWVRAGTCQKIRLYEYWVDDAYASKVVTNVTPAPVLELQTELPLGYVSPGVHTINIRFADTASRWSPVITQFFLKPLPDPPDPEPAAITGCEYWVDNDHAGKTTLSFPAASVYYLADSLNLSTVSPGVHTINIRFRDSKGAWSPVITQFFLKPLPAQPDPIPAAMTGCEYWVDDDLAGKTTLNFPCASVYYLADSLSLGTVSPGVHTINIRFRDSNGTWSPVITQFFLKPLPVPPEPVPAAITGCEYWVDDDLAGKTMLNFPVASVYYLADSLNLSTVSPGVHTINIRFRDSKGAWSSLLTQFFLRQPEQSYVNPDNKIAGYRLWYDDNLATMETVHLLPQVKDLYWVEDLETPFLTVGSHTINVQFMDSLHRYSSAVTSGFVVNSCLPHGGRTISGPSTVCSGQAGVSFSILPVKNAYTYTWSVPPGAVVTSGSNTASITVDFPLGSASGNVSVFASNPCGNGETMILPVTLQPLPDPVIAGAVTTCAGTQETYATATGMALYEWAVSPGGTAVSGGGPADHTITVAWSQAGTQWVQLNYTTPEGCNDTTATRLVVSVLSRPAPTLAGDTAVCEDDGVHTYSTETGMTAYAWLVPQGCTVTAGGGANDPSVTLAWTEPGQKTLQVSYTGSNGCEADSPAGISASVASRPGAAGPVTGPVNVSPGQSGLVYSINPVAHASSYLWIPPVGATITGGAGTNVVILTLGASFTGGEMTVRGVNTCGEGGISPPFQFNFISPVPTSTAVASFTASNGQYVCFNASQVVIIAGSGGTFLVQPGGEATLISGQRILIYPTTIVQPGGELHAYITISGEYCGFSQPSMVSAATVATAGPDGSDPGTTGKGVTCFPNPTTDKLTISVLKDRTDDITFQVVITTLTGNIILDEKFPAGGPMTLHLDHFPAGMYIVRVETGTRTNLWKVIKQ